MSVGMYLCSRPEKVLRIGVIFYVGEENGVDVGE